MIALELDSQGQCSWRHVGTYPDRSAAVAARIDDVIQQLTNNHGRLLHSEHLILGPGPDGPLSIASCITELGADPASNDFGEPVDPTGARRWLTAAHLRERPASS